MNEGEVGTCERGDNGRYVQPAILLLRMLIFIIAYLMSQPSCIHLFVFQFVSMGVLLRSSMVCNCICLGFNVLGLRARSKSRESNEQICQQYNIRREKKANDASEACEESSIHVCWRFLDHLVVPYSLPASDCDSWQVSLSTFASDCNLRPNPRLAEFDCLHSSKIYALQGEESWH